MAVKKPVKKASVKVIAKKPAVTVETKKISNTESCCSKPNCKGFGKLIVLILLVANTVLISLVLINQTKMEALRAGGSENYELLKQVFQTEGYKMQQKQQLDQALQVLSQPQQAAPSAEDLQFVPQEQAQ